MTKTNTNKAFKRKVDFLRTLCLEKERPSFFPCDLSTFANWSDDEQGIRKFSRPILYKAENTDLLNETKTLIRVALDRWRPKDHQQKAHVQHLEATLRTLASGYHLERQLRLDAQQEVEVLRTSVDSLTSKIRDLSGKSPVRLVSTKASDLIGKC